MMWLPRSRYISAMPLRARLLDSVAPEVKMISLEVAPMSLAICSRAFSVAFSASQPKERSEEHTSELQSHRDLVCRLLLEKKKKEKKPKTTHDTNNKTNKYRNTS